MAAAVWPNAQGEEWGPPALLAVEEIQPQVTAPPAAAPTMLPLVPPGAGWCFCYSCAQEAPAAERPDFELQCLRCNATCVERLDPALAGAIALLGLEPPPSGPPSAIAPSGMSPPPPAAAPPAPPRQMGVQRARHTRHRPTQGRLPRIGGGHHHHGPSERRGGQADRHVGIICDGCNARDFAGVRYKCLRCPDFDFCASCHAQRGALHPGHDFETISTPRLAVPPFLVADFFARAAARTSIAIIGIGIGSTQEVHSGLDDQQVAWWLANSKRLVCAEQMAAQEPAWCCPICAEGLEAESANGWVVQICGPQGDDGDEPECEADAEEAPPLLPQGHVYHEACLRRWLVKSNSCPVCRRSPVVPEA